MNWPAHPDDEWIDVTPIGSSEPVLVLGRSGVDLQISRARAQFLAEQITAEEFAAAIDEAIESAKRGD